MVLSSGRILTRIEWETENILLCHVCNGNYCRLFADEKPMWSGDSENHIELLIENACLHQYSFSGE